MNNYFKIMEHLSKQQTDFIGFMVIYTCTLVVFIRFLSDLWKFNLKNPVKFRDSRWRTKFLYQQGKQKT